MASASTFNLSSLRAALPSAPTGPSICFPNGPSPSHLSLLPPLFIAVLPMRHGWKVPKLKRARASAVSEVC